MEFVKMSRKGQLVVPASIRKMLRLKPEDKFIAYGKEDYIVFKKVALPSLKREFDDIVARTTEIAKSRKLTERDIKQEIRKHRAEKRKGAG